MVLIQNHDRHEARARIRQGDSGWPCVEIEDRRRVEGIAVQADDGLVVDRSGLTAVNEFPQPAVLDDVSEIKVGLGANEVIKRDRGDGILGGRGR